MNEEIKISEIQIIPVKPKDGLVAFASFVLDQKYYVGSVAVFTRLTGEGFRLVYPAKKVGERSINTFYPINAETGHTIEKAISEKVYEIYPIRVNENIGR
ncbi:MAG: septation protein SpoVG family protein [bacterium]|nr:septation protein SpoVG family protein [bacterium]